ncbi:MAG: hypothetical protein O3A51_02940 [Verrucomicrobia bacterium]|nr:hypothetical protein [Verrucomicrobiota bacterium]
MNRVVQAGDRVLLTSFHYWTELPPGHACAVFAYYFTGKVSVLLRSHESTFGALLSDIKTYQLDWALLSPPPGDTAHRVFDGFRNALGREPIKLSRAGIFPTSSLYAESTDGPKQDH